jgi:low temperature requirement protein LtrA
VQSFELFVDLLYVGIIAIQGDHTSENPTGLSLLHFVITFALSWKIWNDMSLIISWFETDDIVQRLSILFLLACLFGYTTNITEAFDHTYATLIGFYLCARLFMAAYLLLVAILVPSK